MCIQVVNNWKLGFFLHFESYKQCLKKIENGILHFISMFIYQTAKIEILTYERNHCEV